MGMGWFERGAGHSSGRIAPQVVTPTAGERVFVLGQESPVEPAQLVNGDYVRVSQIVDLTGVDLVGATMETIGTAMGVFARTGELTVDPTVFSVLAAWLMNTDWPHAENEIGTMPHLTGVGDIAPADEDYSALATKCRRIPAGSTTAQLVGVNTPQLWGAGPLPAYTFDVWLNFDADAVPDSDGVSPTVFTCDDGSDGLAVALVGEGGPGPQHRWWPALVHRNGGVMSATLFTAYPITASDGWHLFTFVYDSALAGVDRCKLYVDGALVGSGASVVTLQPGEANVGCPVSVASPDLCGYVDQVRLLGEALDAGEVATEYAQCTHPPIAKSALWSMQIRIDGDLYCERVIAAHERRTWTDFYAPVRHLSGAHRVDFILQLLEEP